MMTGFSQARASEKMQHLTSYIRLRPACIVVCIIALLACGACSSHPTRADFWPLYYHEEIGDRTTTEILWPFGGSTETSEYKEVGAYPVFTSRKEKDPQRPETSSHGLFPFFIHREDPATKRTWVLPLYLRTTKKAYNDGRNVDTTIFPLFWFGTDRKDEDYFAFFPFYGTIRGRLARDEIFFVMWPIYSRSTLKDHVEHVVLWPFIGWSYGGDKESSRVLPFYTYWRDTGTPEFWSVLWPFIHFTRSTGKERVPQDMFYLFPLFGWHNTPTRHSWTVLWPFFSGSKKPGTDYYSWIGPWPIVRLQKDKGLLRRQFWPFYGYLYEHDYVVRYILWPLFREFHKDTEKMKQDEWFLLYLFQNKVYHDKASGRTHVRRMCWPFWRYFNDGHGRRHFMAFAPLWYWDEAGFERNYSRFWRITEYVDDENRDETSWRLLWRLVRYDRYRNYRTFNVLGPLFRYEREPEVQTRFTLLSGLFSIGRRNGGLTLRVLYIPLASGNDTEPAQAGALNSETPSDR